MNVHAQGTEQHPATSPVERAEESSEAPGQVYLVAAIGDSLTAARSHGGKYLTYLKARCPQSRFDNYGIGGQNVEQMRRRFSRDVLGRPSHPRWPKPAYTHVIVFGGVNDVLGDTIANRNPGKIEDDLDEMYAMAHEAGMKVIAVTLPPWEGYTQYYNARRAAATREVNDWIFDQSRLGRVDYALDAQQLLSCGDPGRLCSTYEMRWIRDGLHFNEDAHAKLGQALYESVFADCL